MNVSDYAKKFLSQDTKDITDLIFIINKEDQPIFMLASMPYICLIVNEGYDWCAKSKLQLPIIKSKDTLEKIRSKGKLFANDKNLSFDHQFISIEHLIKIEHQYFKNLAKPYTPDCFIDDIGTYWIGDLCIGNTIQYAYDFSPFSKDNKSIYESVKEIYDFSHEIGSAYQEIHTIITGKRYVINKDACIRVKEHTCLDYTFKRSFKSIRNVIIHSLICRINFLLYYFKKHCRENSMLYLRLIYITYYSLKNDLEALNIEHGDIFDFYHNNTFRNSMAHYSLHNKITAAEIVPNVLIYDT